MNTIPAIGRRLALIAGWARRQPPDGTFNLFSDRRDQAGDAQRLAAVLPEEISDGPGGNKPPGLVALGLRLDRLPRDTKVVLVLPPVFAPALPPSDSPAAVALANCKQAIHELGQARHRTELVDWHRLRPGTELAANFFDSSHYYDGLAAQVEIEIADALSTL